ncbi:MAG: hypothetical protein QOE82_1771 [Thermoanaerobaculia bacterium]|nr:hypothetical protein [Thermoanaerobaculia bacterium]
MFLALRHDYRRFRARYLCYFPGIVVAATIIIYWAFFGLRYWVFRIQPADLRAGWYLVASSVICVTLVIMAGRIRHLPLAVVAWCFFILAVSLPSVICRGNASSRSDVAKNPAEPSKSQPVTPTSTVSSTEAQQNSTTAPQSAVPSDTSGDEDSDEGVTDTAKKADPDLLSPSSPGPAPAVTAEDTNMPWVFAFALSFVGMLLPVMVVRPRLRVRKGTQALSEDAAA